MNMGVAFIGAAVSTLPIGPLNLSLINLGLRDQRRQWWFMALGIVIADIVVATLSGWTVGLWGGGGFSVGEALGIETPFRYLGVFLLFGVGVWLLFSAGHSMSLAGLNRAQRIAGMLVIGISTVILIRLIVYS